MASTLMPASEAAAPRSLAAAVEERLLVPTYGSAWAPATVVAHRGMSLPFQLLGDAHSWWVSFHGRELRLAGIGRKKLVQPLFQALFGELSEPARLERRVLWRPDPLAHTRADMVIAEIHRWMAARFRRSGWVIVPEAVRWLGDLREVPPPYPCGSLKDDLRKVRKNGFTYSQATAPEDWAEFYSEMVQPQARSRHGETAWVPSRRLMRQFAETGVLHFISQNGVRVAGACSLRRGQHLWIPLMGIRHGDPALLRQGAGNAALALTFDWARGSGYRWIDAGRTGPFIHDGLQQSKRKWGLVPVPDPLAHVTAVWVGSDVARQAFSRRPVLVEDGATLQAYAGGAT